MALFGLYFGWSSLLRPNGSSDLSWLLCLGLTVWTHVGFCPQKDYKACVLSRVLFTTGMEMSVHAINIMSSRTSLKTMVKQFVNRCIVGSVCAELLKVCVQACVLDTGGRGQGMWFCTHSLSLWCAASQLLSSEGCWKMQVIINKYKVLLCLKHITKTMM